MPLFVLQAVAFAIVIAGSVVILRLFARQSAQPPRRSRRLIALAAAAGLAGAPLWWAMAPGSFPWSLPPLGFRFLAAFGLALAVLGLAVLARPSPARLRLALGMLALVLALVLGTFLFLDGAPVEGNRPLRWVFGLLAGGMLAGAVLEMLRSPDLRSVPPPGPLARGLWTLIAAALAFAALMVLVLPQGALSLWPQDPLTTRLSGAFLAALALAAWMTRCRAELERPAGQVLAVFGLWVVLAVATQGAGAPLALAYAGALGLIGGYGALRALQR